MSRAAWTGPLSEVTALTGSVAQQYFGRALEIETKGDGSPVTIADRANSLARQIKVDFQGGQARRFQPIVFSLGSVDGD